MNDIVHQSSSQVLDGEVVDLALVLKVAVGGGGGEVIVVVVVVVLVVGRVGAVVEVVVGLPARRLDHLQK